jgi:integrase
VERIEKITIERPLKIETYTPAEFRLLLGAARPEHIPHLILGGLCGARPEESRSERKTQKPSLRWEHFNWKRRVIDLPVGVAKAGGQRPIPICDAAWAFFAPWRERNATGECVPPISSLGNLARDLSRASGVPWKFDALRHSYASYRLAELHNIDKLSDEMGNSPKMIRNHYLDRKRPDEAKTWFALRPQKIVWKRENIY